MASSSLHLLRRQFVRFNCARSGSPSPVAAVSHLRPLSLSVKSFATSTCDACASSSRQPPSRPRSTRHPTNSLAMAPPSRSSSSSSPGNPPSAHREVAVPRPSSSVIVVSDSNEVLLLQRVAKSTSFASAHVFPGGNLDSFHDGDIPTVDSPDRHRDCLPYRLAAIRECFEESGILLTKNPVSLTQEERDKARRRIHANDISFGEYLKSIDAEADTGVCSSSNVQFASEEC
jgi:8-oxo-dGTP pyrophosphatase MutT (NUDIX family)